VKSVFPDAVGIFVMPPSSGELENRLRGRGQDSDEVIRRRLNGALDEMSHVDEFGFVIINKDLQEALEDLLAVVRASRLRSAQQFHRHPEVFHFLDTPASR
jgi:guanylate kinase